jgi:hypothetical protein
VSHSRVLEEEMKEVIPEGRWGEREGGRRVYSIIFNTAGTSGRERFAGLNFATCLNATFCLSEEGECSSFQVRLGKWRSKT